MLYSVSVGCVILCTVTCHVAIRVWSSNSIALHPKTVCNAVFEWMVCEILCIITFVLSKCEAVFYSPPPKCQCIILYCTVILLTLFYWLMWWCKSSGKSCYSAGQAHLCLRAPEGSLPCSYKLSIVFYCHWMESIPCLYILFVYHPL